MNTKVIAIVIAVIVIAGGVFYFSRNKDTEVESDTSSAESATQVSAENTSLKSLISGGRNQTCTFSSSEQNAETNGTIYVGGSKMRGDFEIKSSGATSMSHMIYDGSTSYVWMDGQNTGFKMALDANAESNTSQNQSIDPNKNFEFNCERWSVDNSRFELPSGIEFNELPVIPAVNANINSSTQGSLDTMDTKAMQQAICNNLPEPAKTQCLAGVQ